MLRTLKYIFIRVYFNDCCYSSVIQQTLELLFHDIFLSDTKMNKAASEIFDDIVLDKIVKLCCMIIGFEHIKLFKHLYQRKVPSLEEVINS